MSNKERERDFQRLQALQVEELRAAEAEERARGQRHKAWAENLATVERDEKKMLAAKARELKAEFLETQRTVEEFKKVSQSPKKTISSVSYPKRRSSLLLLLEGFWGQPF